MQDKKELNWQMRGSKLCYLRNLDHLRKLFAFFATARCNPLAC